MAQLFAPDTLISRRGSERRTTAKKIDLVFLKQTLLAKANGKKQLGDLELDGSISSRIWMESPRTSPKRNDRGGERT